MAVLSTRATAATISVLTLRVRKLIGDTDTDTNNQRWLDADIRTELDYSIAAMYTKMSAGNPAPWIGTADLTYTANYRSVSIPTGIEAQSIYKVEDVTTASDPIYIAYRSMDQLDRFSDEDGFSIVGAQITDAGVATQVQSIALRPIPTSAKTLRIYSLAPFIPVSGAATPSTDQHPLNPTFEEVITLGAAIRLQEVDNQVPVTRMARYQELMEEFREQCSRYIGPVYVKNTRILLS